MTISCDENGIINKIVIEECPGCGKRYKTEKGLSAHLKNCEDYIAFMNNLRNQSPVATISVSASEVKMTTQMEIDIEELKKEVEEIKNQLKVLNLWK